jgi:uncharacterized membrane protein
MKQPDRTSLFGPAALLAAALWACAETPTEAFPSHDKEGEAFEPQLSLASGFLGHEDFDYTVIRHPEGTHTYVNRMNARGQVVGDFLDASGRWDGFLHHEGGFERISFPGSAWTYAYGINDRGDIVGTYSAGGIQSAYILAKGEYRKLDAPPGYQTRAYDINSRGTVSGAYHTGAAGTKWQPAIWEQDFFTPLPVITSTLGADMAEGFGINDRGEVVGHYTVPGDVYTPPGNLKMYGFVYRDGAVTASLDYPGSGWMSCAWGMGPDGTAAGHYTDVATPEVNVAGYLWKEGSFTARLVAPGAISTFPSVVTRNGVIAGYAVLGHVTPTGGYVATEWVGFVATPKAPGWR